MMRTMRAITKPVFWIVAISFVGWLAYGQVTEILGGGKDVVLKVDGHVVRATQYQGALQAAYEQARRQAGGRLPREDEQQIQNQLVDQLIAQILLSREYRRLGITVTDDEVIQAARSSPPPQVLRQVMEDPTFQTNGQFDITKWQRFLSSGTSPDFYSQIEALYREYLPERKLQEYLTVDVYVSDAKLWRIYRDQHESVTVAMLAVRPEQMPDSLAPVSDADLERYYAAHRDDYKRAPIAWLSFVAQPRLPDHADTVAALVKVSGLRAEIARGAAKFEDVAKRESLDSVSGAKGGDVGWVKRDQPAFDKRFLEGMRRLSPGELSQPVLSSFGYHLIRVDATKGDSVHVRHILIPIVLQGTHLDYVEARGDTLDRLAAEQTDGSRLDSAAKQLTLPLARAPKLVEGERLTLGRYVIPDVGVWAFEARVGETSPVIEGEAAYYVFRLDSLFPAGVAPLAQIRGRVLEAARFEKKREVARRRAEEIVAQVAGTPNLLAAGRALGLAVQKLGPVTRLSPPGELVRDPLVLGAAFGLRPGERSGLLPGMGGFYVLQGIARKPADSTAWLKQRDAQREAILQPARQARIQAYLAGLRARAKVVDRRKELSRTQASSGS